MMGSTWQACEGCVHTCTILDPGVVEVEALGTPAPLDTEVRDPHVLHPKTSVRHLPPPELDQLCFPEEPSLGFTPSCCPRSAALARLFPRVQSPC